MGAGGWAETDKDEQCVWMDRSGLGEACTKTLDSGHDSQATKSEVQKYFFIFFFLLKYLFIYLAVSGLNCGTWDILVAECGIGFSCSR